MKNQSGSAIIMLFIAVALFGALAYAFLQGSRSSTSFLTDEQAKAYATEIIEYSNTVRMAAKRLHLRGCKDTQISAENGSGNYVNPNAPTNNTCHIFNVAGGGIKAGIIPQEWISVAPNSWNPWFNIEMAIEGIGTPKAELVMWITNIKPEICTQINRMNGMATSFSMEPLTMNGVEYDGTYIDPAFDTIGDDPGSPYKGKEYACWGVNFFHVVLGR